MLSASIWPSRQITYLRSGSVPNCSWAKYLFVAYNIHVSYRKTSHHTCSAFYLHRRFEPNMELMFFLLWYSVVGSFPWISIREKLAFYGGTSASIRQWHTSKWNHHHSEHVTPPWMPAKCSLTCGSLYYVSRAKWRQAVNAGNNCYFCLAATHSSVGIFYDENFLLMHWNLRFTKGKTKLLSL